MIKVLIFDHNESLRELFSRFLDKSKFQVTFTPTFPKFLKEFKTKEYKACFLDIDQHLSNENLDKFVREMQNIKLVDDYFKLS